MPDDAGLALITIDDAIKLCQDTLDKGAAVAQWLTQALQDPEAVTVYHGQVDNVTRGAMLDFTLTDVDDEATLSFSGLVTTCTRGQEYRGSYPVELLGGPQAVGLTVVNSGGFNWSAHLVVNAPGATFNLIDAFPQGDDNLYLNRRRIYIWTFFGVQ